MPVAETTGPLTGHEIVARDIRQPGDLGVKEGNINGLTMSAADAGEKSSLDGIGGKQTGSDVNDGNPHLHGLAVRLAGYAHHAAAPLDDEIVARQLTVRPRLAVTGNRAVDEAGVQCLELVVPQAEFRQLADLEVLDQHVAEAGQPADNFLPGGGLEIHRDA